MVESAGSGASGPPRPEPRNGRFSGPAARWSRDLVERASAEVRSAPVRSFFILTYLFAWILWVPQAAMDLRGTGWRMPFWEAGIFAPTLAALALGWVLARWEGVMACVGGLLRVKAEPRWYAAVFLLPLVVTLVIFAVTAVFDPDLTPGNLFPWKTLPALFLGVLFSWGLGQEPGWRGYALPGLQEGRSAFWASILLGLLWSLWHLPLLFIEGAAPAGVPVAWLMALVVPFSVMLTWLYNSTDGSLVLVVLMVAGFWTALSFLHPALETGVHIAMAILLVILWICALYLGWWAGPNRLKRGGGRRYPRGPTHFLHG